FPDFFLATVSPPETIRSNGSMVGTVICKEARDEIGITAIPCRPKFSRALQRHCFAHGRLQTWIYSSRQQRDTSVAVPRRCGTTLTDLHPHAIRFTSYYQKTRPVHRLPSDPVPCIWH